MGDANPFRRCQKRRPGLDEGAEWDWLPALPASSKFTSPRRLEVVEPAVSGGLREDTQGELMLDVPGGGLVALKPV